MDGQHEAAEAGGDNPHYRPLLMRWNEVAVVADAGTSFGLQHDADGRLTVVVRHPGRPWPHGVDDATLDGRNTIEPGCTMYVVSNDERGPAVGHEFRPDPDRPGRCLDCPAGDDTYYVP